MIEAIELIIMVGVVGNFMLQLFWYFKTTGESKGSTNESEIEFHDRIEEYLQLRIHNEQVIKERDKLWTDFQAEPQSEEDKNFFRTEFEPKRKEDGKYNPDDINGALDGMFGEKDV